MRTQVGITALALLFPAIAAASPIDGRWSIDRDCIAPEQNGDVGPFTFAGNKMTFFESECVISKMTPIGKRGTAWRAKAKCSGEGETWTADWVLGLDKDGDGKVRQLVEVDMKDGYVTVYWPCK